MLNLVMKKDRINILFIVILTLIIGGFCLEFLPSFPVISDSEEYNTVALNLVQGKGFMLDNEPTGETPPGYPLFLASIYYLFGYDYQIVKLIQFILLAGMGIIVYLMTRKFLNFQPTLSFLSSLTFVLWPYFVVYPLFIVSEILFIFFFLLSTYFLLTFLKEPSLKNSIIAGGLLGIATLVRPVTLLLPFWLAFLLLFFLKAAGKRAYFLKLVIILMVFTAVLTPWTVRNYLVFQRFVPIGTFLPKVIEKGYVRLDYTEGSQALKPWEANFKTMALARLKNIYLFWNPGAKGTNAQIIKETFPIMGTLFHIYRIFFFIILALAFWSLRLIRKNKEIFVLWIIIFYFWALHIILFPYPRYTLPIIPLVIILAWFTLRNIGYKILNKSPYKIGKKT